MLEPVKRIIRPLIYHRLHQTDIDLDYEYYGSDYGGWPLAMGCLDEDSLVYSFGLGCDISFDLSVISKHGCAVHGFDPTPISVAWLNQQATPKQFNIHQVGVSSIDSTLEMFAPYKGDYVSFSISPKPGKDLQRVEVPTLRVSSIMEKFNHGVPDLVKMDIEGFEYSVLDDMMKTDIKPRQILVEFHHGKYNLTKSDTLACVQRVLDAGYRLFYVSNIGFEYGFIRMSKYERIAHFRQNGPNKNRVNFVQNPVEPRCAGIARVNSSQLAPDQRMSDQLKPDQLCA